MSKGRSWLMSGWWLMPLGGVDRFHIWRIGLWVLLCLMAAH